MIKLATILALFFLIGSVHSNPACDEGVAEQSFWGSLFGGSSDVEAGCEPTAIAANTDSINPDEIRALIADGRINLERILEEYKNSTGEEIHGLDQGIDTLKSELLDLRGMVNNIDEISSNQFTVLNEDQLKNRALVTESNNELKLLVASVEERLMKINSDMSRVESELTHKVEGNRQEANKSVDELGRLVGDNVIYLVVSVVVVLLIMSALAFFLRKKISVQGVDLTGSLVDTRRSLEEEFVKLDEKLVEVLEAQISTTKSNSDASGEDVDHSLVIKVADEIVRIQKNIARMDDKTKGLKQLSASVTRIQDNVASNGYEIVEMLGIPYSKGMKAAVDFIVDEELEAGEQLITRVIKPQINYQGVMIQSAQIEVSQGE